MYEGRYVFSQVMAHLPWKTFHRCVTRHRGDHKVKSFGCTQQWRAMAIAQLLQLGSLRDIEISLRAHADKLYHLGLPTGVSRNTLSNANQVRSWKIYADFGCRLIGQAQALYDKDDFQLQLEQPAYALDSSTIDLCLSLFSWATFRTTKAGVKMHTLLNLQGNIPSFIEITEAKKHDVKVLDQMPVEAGAIYIMDRAYLDFERLYQMHCRGGQFIVRAKSNTKLRRLYSNKVERQQGVICDQIIVPAGVKTAKCYPEKLRKVGYHDQVSGKRFNFLTNNQILSPLTIAELYRNRWQVELFFKWVKQHLRIKTFYGRSENAVKTQIWIAVSVYALVAIIKKRLHLDHSLYTILQILSVTVFDKYPLYQILTNYDRKWQNDEHPKQLNLFDKTLGH